MMDCRKEAVLGKTICLVTVRRVAPNEFICEISLTFPIAAILLPPFTDVRPTGLAPRL